MVYRGQAVRKSKQSEGILEFGVIVKERKFALPWGIRINVNRELLL